MKLPEADILDEGDVIVGMPVAAVADLVIEIIDLFRLSLIPCVQL
jgi:hypothetical protein